MSGGGSYKYPMEPVFIDQLAVDFVVCDHLYMRLTSAEKRHAVHRLIAQGLTHSEIGIVMRLAKETVSRLALQPPPPILDIDQHGQCVLVDG